MRKIHAIPPLVLLVILNLLIFLSIWLIDALSKGKIPQSYSHWADLVISFIAITVALFVYSLTQIHEKRKHELEEEKDIKNQKQLIKSVEEIILEAGETASNQLKEITNNHIPSYKIPNFDYTYFVSRIYAKIENKETWIMKRLMIKIWIKIDTINNLISLSSNSENANKLKLFFGELSKKNKEGGNKGKFSYYQDLFDIKSEFHSEVSKFLK